jgi:pseudouridine-5'-phosphate glycosidase
MSSACNAGLLPLNSSVRRLSQAQASCTVSRGTFSWTSPAATLLAAAIFGVRMLTVNVLTTDWPGAVWTFSSIRRRSSALTVVLAAAGPPSLTVTL